MHRDCGKAGRKHQYALSLQGETDFLGAIFQAQGEGDDMGCAKCGTATLFQGLAQEEGVASKSLPLLFKPWQKFHQPCAGQSMGRRQCRGMHEG